MKYRIEIVSDSKRCRPRLHIDHQSFYIGDWLDSKDDLSAKQYAEWFKRQLDKALKRLLAKEK